MDSKLPHASRMYFLCNTERAVTVLRRWAFFWEDKGDGGYGSVRRGQDRSRRGKAQKDFRVERAPGKMEERSLSRYLAIESGR